MREDVEHIFQVAAGTMDGVGVGVAEDMVAEDMVAEDTVAEDMVAEDMVAEDTEEEGTFIAIRL